jgi:hypothetical protein
MALAVAALSDREVGRIILTRPAVEAGERLGFLPGDLLAKVDPYLRPLYDALYDMLDADRLTAYMEKGAIEVAPLAYMRGRTINDSFIILDEAQNTSPEQMQMFLTRLGFGSKIVVTGDITQIDLPTSQASGLISVRDVLGSIDGISFVEFSKEDVVRHQARPADRRGLPHPRGGDRDRADAYARSGDRRDRGRETARGLEVDGAAAADHARRVLRPRGSRTASSGSRSSARTRAARSSASTSGSTRRPTCSRSRSTAATLPPGSRAARRRRPLPAGRGRRLAPPARARPAPPARLRPRAEMEQREEALSAMSTRRRPASRAPARSRPGTAPVAAARHRPGPPRISVVESFNYAVEGIIHVLRRTGTCGSTSRGARRPVLALWIGVDRIELIVLLISIAVRPDRGDDQLRDRGGNRRRRRARSTRWPSWRRTSRPAPS